VVVGDNVGNLHFIGQGRERSLCPVKSAIDQVKVINGTISTLTAQIRCGNAFLMPMYRLN
jgi:hypothetical protein